MLSFLVYNLQSKSQKQRAGVLTANMDSELKETLLKAADYNELEKQRAARTGNLSFSIMFLVCAMTIAVQMLIAGSDAVQYQSYSLIMGETAALFAGGLIYLFCVVKNGAWNGALTKSTPKRDLIITLICAGIFSIVFCLMLKKNIAASQAVGMAICFFAVLSEIAFFWLRGLLYLSQKKSDKLEDGKA